MSSSSSPFECRVVTVRSSTVAFHRKSVRADTVRTGRIHPQLITGGEGRIPPPCLLPVRSSRCCPNMITSARASRPIFSRSMPSSARTAVFASVAAYRMENSSRNSSSSPFSTYTVALARKDTLLAEIFPKKALWLSSPKSRPEREPRPPISSSARERTRVPYPSTDVRVKLSGRMSPRPPIVTVPVPPVSAMRRPDTPPPR
mmetsp:Transcript_48867/g.95543  ORF Transcript_48867/g.95543 Transcript_48867/m.95543 type:complete len:202 (-) Transcript_48867:1195-1800(-)